MYESGDVQTCALDCLYDFVFEYRLSVIISHPDWSPVTFLGWCMRVWLIQHKQGKTKCTIYTGSSKCNRWWRDPIRSNKIVISSQCVIKWQLASQVASSKRQNIENATVITLCLIFLKKRGKHKANHHQTTVNLQLSRCALDITAVHKRGVTALLEGQEWFIQVSGLEFRNLCRQVSSISETESKCLSRDPLTFWNSAFISSVSTFQSSASFSRLLNCSMGRAHVSMTCPCTYGLIRNCHDFRSK